MNRWTWMVLVAGIGAASCKELPAAGAAGGCGDASSCPSGQVCADQTCQPAPGTTGSAAKTGPSQTKRTVTGECNELIALTNRKPEAHEGLNAETPEDLKKLSVWLDGMARKCGKLQLHDTKLRALRDEYQKFASKLAAASRDAANAEDDQAKLEAAVKTMQSIGPQEDRLVADINQYCRQVSGAPTKRAPGKGFSIPIPAGFVTYDEGPFKAIVQDGGVVLLASEKKNEEWGRASINVAVIKPEGTPLPSEKECKEAASGMSAAAKTVLRAELTKLSAGSICMIDAKDQKLDVRRYRFAILPSKGNTWMLTCTFDSRDATAEKACTETIQGWKADP